MSIGTAKEYIYYNWSRFHSLESVEQNARHANGHTRDWRRETRGARKQRDSLFSSRGAAVVSRVSRLRRFRARAMLSQNLKKKRDCSQSIILRKRIIWQFQIFPLLSSMGVVGAPGNTTKYPAYSNDIRHALEVFCEIKDSSLLPVQRNNDKTKLISSLC